MATPCPDGKWTPSTGASSLNDCIPCERGKWCIFETMYNDRASNGFTTWKANFPDFTLDELTNGKTSDDSDGLCTANALAAPCTFAGFINLGDYYGSCDNGHICYEGATISNPTDGIEGTRCPIGHYCETGVLLPKPCPPGYYQDTEGEAVCKTCPATMFCETFGMTQGTECEKGFYCQGT